MNRFVNLLVVGAVLGSAADAGERSLLAKLNPFYKVHAQDPVPVPATEPLPAANGPALTPLPMPAPGHGDFTAPVQPRYAPVPAGPAFGGPALPAPGYAPPVQHGYPVHATPAPRVKIEDPENIHPHAVRTVVMVPPPCDCREFYGCDLVPVEICVPPCVCEKHKVRRNGHYQEFDFGKYEVEIRVKDKYIEVDYDD